MAALAMAAFHHDDRIRSRGQLVDAAHLRRLPCGQAHQHGFESFIARRPPERFSAAHDGGLIFSGLEEK